LQFIIGVNFCVFIVVGVIVASEGKISDFIISLGRGRCRAYEKARSQNQNWQNVIFLNEPKDRQTLSPFHFSKMSNITFARKCPNFIRVHCELRKKKNKKMILEEEVSELDTRMFASFWLFFSKTFQCHFFAERHKKPKVKCS
jgi:hypothetical protein